MGAIETWAQYRLITDIAGATLLVIVVGVAASLAVVDIFNSKRRPRQPRWRKIPGSTL